MCVAQRQLVIAWESLQVRLAAGRRQKKTVTLSDRVEQHLRLGHTGQLFSWFMRGLAAAAATWQIKLVCGTKSLTIEHTAGYCNVNAHLHQQGLACIIANKF